MAQQTKSKSSASSGSRSNRRNSPARGRTAAKSRSSASRSKNARTSQRKARPRASSGEPRRVRRTTRAPSKQRRMQRPRAQTPPVTPSCRPPKSSRLRRSPPERGSRESLRVLPSLATRTRGSSASGCQVVAVLGGQRRRVSATRRRTLARSPSGPGRSPNRCASQARRSARTLGPASPSPRSRSSWRALRVARNQGQVDRDLQ